jgi:outer membrane protein assembly factor BamB
MKAVVRAIVALSLLAAAGAAISVPSGPVRAAQPTTAGATGFGSDWPVYHHDVVGDGVDSSGTSLSPATAAWTSTTLDGEIYGEPLVEAGRVVVATENNTVYELAANTGVVMWSTHIGPPVPSGTLPCTNITPTVGITGTPVIDPARGEIFVVTDEPTGSSAQHYLVGLDVDTGGLVLHQAISLPGSDQLAQLQRTGLTLDNGNVIEGFGGNAGDCGSYHGWVVSIPEGGGSQRSFEVATNPGDSKGAVWMGGAAPVVDTSGNVWFATGNSAFTSSTDTYDNSDSVVELNSSLSELQSFAPSTWYSDNGADLDLGSSAPVLFADGLAFQAGKSKTAYVLAQSALGGVGGQRAVATSYCGANVDGGSAVSGDVAYTPCQAGVVATQVTPGTPPGITSMWQTSTRSGGPPILAGGLVWTIDHANGTLYGLDPSTGNETQSFSVGSIANDFPTPTVADGLLLAVTTNQVHAFDGPAGLPSPPASSTGFHITTTSLLAATRGAGYGAQLYATGGVPPYRWKRIAGVLPRGLRLRADGLLAGTPGIRTAPGDYTFTAEAMTHRARGSPRQIASQTLVLQLT